MIRIHRELKREMDYLILRAHLHQDLKKFIPPRLREMFGSIFRREKVFIMRTTLADACFKIEAMVEVDVRLVQPDDFPKIAKKFKIKEMDMAHFAPSISIAKGRFKMGDICIAAEIHGDLVHLAWVTFNEVYIDGLERKMRMSSDSAFMYGNYTVPEFRGLGITPKVMEKTYSYLYNRGIRKLYGAIRHDNFASLRATRKAGARKIGTITYTKIFKLRLYRCENETEEDYNKLKSMLSL